MSSYDKLLELINTDNPIPQPLTRDAVDFSPPTVEIGESWNTRVTVSANPGSGYTGQVDVRYRRIDLAELGNDVSLLSEEPFTLETIVSMLNATRGAFLLVSDVEAVTVPAMGVGDIETVVLKARSDSLGWIGITTVSLMVGFSDFFDAANRLHTLLHTTLPSSGYFT